jgi:RNA 3'-terminal phosphate cyclase
LPVDIDGSRGEGGGQILRTSLALAILTGRKLRMKQIRAGRKKPGLQRQHLACVEAAARLSSAQTNPLEVGASELVFTPSPIEAWPGELQRGLDDARRADDSDSGARGSASRAGGDHGWHA